MSEKCRACGAKLEFILNENGKRIPAQRVTLLYELSADMLGEKRLVRMADSIVSSGREVYISHFQTCPQADRFSSGKRGK